MTEALSLTFDALVALGLLWLGWRVLREPGAFRAVVLFIALGLLSALAWARLRAPDLALAEAAIGAGITGALLLDVLGGLHRRRGLRPFAVRGAALVTIGLAGALAAVAAVAVTGGGRDGLGVAVAEALRPDGVSNPVTFVLLDLRAWDTLLELAVMLAALVGAVAVRHAGEDRSSVAPLPPSAVMLGLGGPLVPAMVLVGVYLFWIGSSAPGGAFQGGALAAAAGILLLLSSRTPPLRFDAVPCRLAASVGVAGMLAVGMACGLAGEGFLALPGAWQYALVLLMEGGIALATAATLAMLFAAAHTPGGPARGATS